MSLKRIVEETDTLAGRLFDGVVIGLILLTIVAFSLETMPDLSHEVLQVLQWVELVSVLVFTLEYVLSSGGRPEARVRVQFLRTR